MSDPIKPCRRSTHTHTHALCTWRINGQTLPCLVLPEPFIPSPFPHPRVQLVGLRWEGGWLDWRCSRPITLSAWRVIDLHVLHCAVGGKTQCCCSGGLRPATVTGSLKLPSRVHGPSHHQALPYDRLRRYHPTAHCV